MLILFMFCYFQKCLQITFVAFVFCDSKWHGNAHSIMQQPQPSFNILCIEYRKGKHAFKSKLLLRSGSVQPSMNFSHLQFCTCLTLLTKCQNYGLFKNMNMLFQLRYAEKAKYAARAALAKKLLTLLQLAYCTK